MRRLAAAPLVAGALLGPAAPASACVVPDCVVAVVERYVEVADCVAYVYDPVSGYPVCVP